MHPRRHAVDVFPDLAGAVFAHPHPAADDAAVGRPAGDEAGHERVFRLAALAVLVRLARRAAWLLARLRPERVQVAHRPCNHLARRPGFTSGPGGGVHGHLRRRRQILDAPGAADEHVQDRRADQVAVLGAQRQAGHLVHQQIRVPAHGRRQAASLRGVGVMQRPIVDVEQVLAPELDLRAHLARGR